jgi:hypothetical protein
MLQCLHHRLRAAFTVIILPLPMHSTSLTMRLLPDACKFWSTHSNGLGGFGKAQFFIAYASGMASCSKAKPLLPAAVRVGPLIVKEQTIFSDTVVNGKEGVHLRHFTSARNECQLSIWHGNSVFSERHMRQFESLFDSLRKFWEREPLLHGRCNSPGSSKHELSCVRSWRPHL